MKRFLASLCILLAVGVGAAEDEKPHVVLVVGTNTDGQQNTQTS